MTLVSLPTGCIPKRISFGVTAIGPAGEDTGLGAGEGVGLDGGGVPVATGVGVSLGIGVGLATGVMVGLWTGVGEPGVALTVGLALEEGVGTAVDVAVALEEGVGFAVDDGEALGVETGPEVYAETKVAISAVPHPVV